MQILDKENEKGTARHRELYSQLLTESSAEGFDRREFLKLLGASIAFAGLSGCQIRQPVETIVPYVRQPENIVPGNALFFATAMSLGGYGLGLLVESHEGRPTKVEGNPQHPSSLGATNVFAQASVLDLYDPDRSQTPLYLGEIRTGGDFLREFRAEVYRLRTQSGRGLGILTETITSPALSDQLKNLIADFPQAKLHQFEPCNRDNVFAGMQLASGAFLEPIYHFDKAKVVLSLDSDFLTCGPGSVRYSRDFMSRRRVRQDKKESNRLYIVEATLSNTGAIADHRRSLKPSEVETIARQIANAIDNQGNSTSDDWINAVARDLQLNRGASLVVAGEEQPPAVHALAHRMNSVLGNVGNTVSFIAPVVANPTSQLESLRKLVDEMNAGQVETLVILGGNPVYNAPSDFQFAAALTNVPLRVHLSPYYDETSALCHWHLNEAHYLESWADTRSYDGTVSIIQPLIAPLYSGKTAHEVLTVFTDQPERSSFDIVRSYWSQHHEGESSSPVAPQPRSGLSQQTSRTAPSKTPTVQLSPKFEEWWSKTLRDGVAENTASKPVAISSMSQTIQSPAESTVSSVSSQASAQSGNIEIAFRADPSIYDGRFANNGWLQELPKPLTKLTWDNAMLISPGTANRLGLSTRPATRGGEHGTNIADLAELSIADRSVRGPIWILPGQPEGVVTIHLGYGRTRAGKIGTSTGFDAYQLRRSDNYWTGLGQLKATGITYSLACTQAHFLMEGRELVRSGSLDEYFKEPEFAKAEADKKGREMSLYPGWKYDSYAWGMSIDTGTCIGCNACVIACQAENNIPVVGKEEVMHGREMHWIRIDRYFEGDQNNPDTSFQPVPCMHCENAPCELVCPVEATTHSDEGLNEMTYNRCVGTRYCSNNCPYKVRRFNFFEYAQFDQPIVQLQRNPDVTVRSRGVMEKCTYCLQRISFAKIQAEKEGRRVADGEITPACQQVCPVEAIVFGDINDPNSRVSRLKREPTDYGLLAELNTRPRTTYLARIRNPNNEITNATT